MTAGTLTRPAVTVDAPEFAAAASWVAKHLPRAPAAPQLAGLLLEPAGNQLAISGFDYDTATRAIIDAQCDGFRRVLVSGRLVSALAATFPDKPLTLSVDGTVLRVVCGSIRASLPLMPADDYPTLPAQPPAIGTVDAA